MLRWYLIRTKPASEAIAQTNLERQGYGVYLPRALQPVRCRGRWRDRNVALFPSYLFLHLSEGCQALAPVRSSVGVASVVRFGTHYAIVPDEVICDLQVRADPQSGLHRIGRAPSLTQGASVRIDAGPFSGLDGVFEREVGADRVVILLRILGHDASVRVPTHCVVPALHA